MVRESYQLDAREDILRIAPLILFLALPAFAEDFYVAEVLLGNGGGSSAANATNKAFFNTAANWGSGAGKISAGDTVYFVGTHTTNAVINGSGSAGSPIAIRFEAGAKFSKGTWNQSGSNGDAALYGNGRSYIDVDGGGNQDVDFECTSNGTGLTTSNHAVGIQFDGSAFINVYGVRATNMYLRTTGSENNPVGGCVQFRSGANSIMVSNCIVSDANASIYVAFTAGNSNIFIFNNWGDQSGEACLLVSSSNGSSTLTNLLVSGNTFRQGSRWSGVADIHQNGAHIYAFHTGSEMRGFVSEKNTWAGVFGSAATGFLFLEGFIYTPYVINDLFVPDTSAFAGNGALTIKGATNCHVLNNTFIGQNAGTAIGTTAFGGGMDGGTRLTNNLVYDWGHGVYDSTAQVIGANYNIFYSCDNMTVVGLYSFGVFSTHWQGVSGFDSNGTSSQPTLDASYVPTSADSVARNAGFTVTAVTTDKRGTSRPQGSAYDIGAFEYAPTDPDLPVVSTQRKARTLNFTR